ncbi:MAG: TrkA C-terminal domain-containing protein [Thermoanaerobaculia bacterium]
MLANILSYVVQRSLTHGRRYPTLYESQVERREDSPLHRGVFVRRAVEMIESGDLDASEIRLPKLIHLLRFGEPVQITEGGGSLVSLEVGPGSGLDGRTVAATVGAIEGVTAVAVLREDDTILPRGPTVLCAGDRLLAMVREPAHEPLQRIASGKPE